MHRPGSATSPRPGGVRSTARSRRPSAWTTLLVPATAVAARAGAAVSASESTVVEASSSAGSRPGAASDGGLVEQFLQVLAEFAVVEPDDQPQPGVEAAGDQRGPDVGLVVVIDERQRGGMLDTGFGEYGLGQDGGLQHPGGAAAPRRWRTDSPRRFRRGDVAPRVKETVVRPAVPPSPPPTFPPVPPLLPFPPPPAAVGRRPGHRRRHAVEQRRGTGPPDDRRPYGAFGGRYDQRHPFAVDTTQLGRQPVREGIVPAHHHVRTAIVRPALIRKARHNSTECLTGTDGCTGACRKGVEAGVPRDTGRPNRPWTVLPEGW